MTDERRQKKQIKNKEWFKNLTEEKRKDGINIFLKGDEPKPKKKKGKKPKLTPEERKENKKEVNRQYQLKNKEVLKERRKGKRNESKKSLSPEERKERRRELRYLKKGISPPPPRKPKLSPEERKERKKEYYKKKWEEMTVLLQMELEKSIA